MGNCMTNTPKEHKHSRNVEIPSDQDDSSSEFPSDSAVESRSQHRSTPNLFDTRSLKARNYLIQILFATNIGTIDNTSNCHAFVVLKIRDSDTNQQKGDNITSLHRITNTNPIWNCYRTFKASEFHDKLVFDICYSNDHQIGSGEVKISELFVNIDDKHLSNGTAHLAPDTSEEDEDCLQEVIIHTNNNNNHETMLYFKLFAMQGVTPVLIEKKSIFFIYKQDNKQIQHTMIMKLNQRWKEQKDNDNIDLNEFLSTQIIYSSPLCTMIQIAMISLLDHPCLDRKGIQYLCNLREIKNEEHKRVNQEIDKAMQDIERYNTHLSDKIRKIHQDLNDCTHWSDDVDTKKHFDQRLMDFMYYIRYSNECLVVCVVHQLWFKGFIQRYVDIKDIDKYRSNDMVQNMMHETEETDDNMRCVRVDIAFSDKFKNGLEIEDVHKMFDTDEEEKED